MSSHRAPRAGRFARRNTPVMAMAENPEPGLRVRLCGDLQIEVAGGRVEFRLTRRKSRELLALLLLTGRTMSRSTLIELLWPEQPPGSRDAALRQLLTELRSCLGSGAIASGGEVSLGVPISTWVDVWEARAEVDRAVTRSRRASSRPRDLMRRMPSRR